MELYANINKTSKYFPCQVSPKPFRVTLSGYGEFCWQGNSNQYRTSDLDFFTSPEPGKFLPHQLIVADLPLLFRITEAIRDSITEDLESKDLQTLGHLYELNEDSSIKALRRLLTLFPSQPPTCQICGKRYDRCEGHNVSSDEDALWKL